jgi:bifunctional ADP-heptose synthase (sugar kinase/adenylyltransferase)
MLWPRRKKFSSWGPQNVIISLGKAGAIFYDGQAAWLAESPVIEEHNPIGAGDSMVGGLVYGLSQGTPVAEALAWGIACGAATASLAGTAVGSADLVQSLLAQVKIKNWRRKMSFTINDEKRYAADPQAVYRAALGAIAGLEGKVLRQDTSAGVVEASFDKKVRYWAIAPT